MMGRLSGVPGLRPRARRRTSPARLRAAGAAPREAATPRRREWHARAQASLHDRLQRRATCRRPRERDNSLAPTAPARPARLRDRATPAVPGRDAREAAAHQPDRSAPPSIPRRERRAARRGARLSSRRGQCRDPAQSRAPGALSVARLCARPTATSPRRSPARSPRRAREFQRRDRRREPGRPLTRLLAVAQRVRDAVARERRGLLRQRVGRVLVERELDRPIA